MVANLVYWRRLSGASKRTYLQVLNIVIIVKLGEAEMHSFSNTNDQVLYNQFNPYFLCRVS
jgi:hypothetical protein